jgi:hypothetical protein
MNSVLRGLCEWFQIHLFPLMKFQPIEYQVSACQDSVNTTAGRKETCKGMNNESARVAQLL